MSRTYAHHLPPDSVDSVETDDQTVRPTDRPTLETNEKGVRARFHEELRIVCARK